jgi:hypothetical protein
LWWLVGAVCLLASFGFGWLRQIKSVAEDQTVGT